MTPFNLSCRQRGFTEPLDISLELDGQRIKGAEIRHGAVHRGIEAMARGRDPFQVLALAERVCGSCSLSNAVAFVRAMETLSSIVVPRRASYLRTLFLELERMASHFLWLASTCRVAGQSSLAMSALSLREEVLNLLERLSGRRSNWGVVTFGGVRCDIDAQGAAAIGAMISFYRRELPPFQEAFRNGTLLRARMEGIGLLPKETALLYGSVGPVARGSGLAVDLRWSSPYEAYGELEGQAVLGGIDGRPPRGDVFDRLLVRVGEIGQSLDLVQALLEGLPEGAIRTNRKRGRLHTLLKQAEGAALSLVEGPRGETLHRLVLRRGEGGLSSWRIRSATYANASLWPLLLKGALLDDALLILSSTDPCMACTERLIETPFSAETKALGRPEVPEAAGESR
ncbi:nickel-dependent hydrogenase large subunit [Aminithiophilus ramosus]|uniref:Nickel-dependent hydrogenase large subunit n=1 Tax=Aminithiophilus ramosus TaxID=3029084 RepID=A0A9Q7ALP6_9BACT|nr:nickel-dependent hydrogenase large subunit [Aminithiophilus ramosus]QTX31322.1 nickel-dependent hydrogenase large subunit [Aminithiophilus ramosus]